MLAGFSFLKAVEELKKGKALRSTIMSHPLDFPAKKKTSRVLYIEISPQTDSHNRESQETSNFLGYFTVRSH